MTCLECGEEFKIISNTHLNKCCSLTVAQYKNKHKLRYVSDFSVRILSVGENNNNYKHGRTFNSKCSMCGVNITGRGKSTLCVSCGVKGENNPFYGKSHSPAVVKKLVAAHKTRSPNTYVGGTGNTTHEERSNSAKRRWVGMSLTERHKRLSSFILAGNKSCRRNKDTSIEVVAQNALLNLNIKFNKNVHIKNTLYHVDLMIEGELIIEIYGDYWHCSKTMFTRKQYNKSIGLYAIQKRRKDANRLRKIRKEGYVTVVIWEHENIPKRIKEEYDKWNNNR